MSMIDQMIANQLQKDRHNEVVAKTHNDHTGSAHQLVRGVVKAVHANGTYQVAILANDGVTEVKVFDSVFSKGSHSVNQTVELKFTSQDYCEILATGGGGSSCSMTINALGVIFE